jgi:hypothetical protein
MATASAALPGAAIPDDQFVEVHPQHAGQPRLRRRGALAYLAAYDTGRTRVFGHCAASTGIEPFMALVEQVMTREPYASATRVFWIVDNGSSHCGQAAIDRLAKRFPNAVMVHTPRHASWLNQIEIYFPVVQRKAVAPNDFTHLDQLRQRLADFQQRYNATARPLGWKVTSADLDDLLQFYAKKQRRSRGGWLPSPDRAIRAFGSTTTSRIRDRSMTSHRRPRNGPRGRSPR